MDAVIVATARTPIGRAGKGSLVDCRPDDLSAGIVRCVARQGPGARSGRGRGRDLGLRAACGRGGIQHGAGRRHPRGARPCARCDGQPVLLVVAPDHPHGGARDPAPARATCSSPVAWRPSAGSRTARPTAFPARTTRSSRAPTSAAWSAAKVAYRRGHLPKAFPTSTSRWARRPRTSPTTAT